MVPWFLEGSRRETNYIYYNGNSNELYRQTEKVKAM
jgi:hypothetical protein